MHRKTAFTLLLALGASAPAFAASPGDEASWWDRWSELLGFGSAKTTIYVPPAPTPPPPLPPSNPPPWWGSCDFSGYRPICHEN